MVKVKPFKGIRPPKDLVEKVASRPYDVLNSEEARAEAEGNPMSLYHIIKPEIDFEYGTDEHEEKVYLKAVENFAKFRENSWLQKDKTEHYYVYAQTMNGHTQYGIVLCAYIDDYLTGKIKKHELTRKDKEEDRMKHIRMTNANIEPVFLAYPFQPELDKIVSEIIKNKPEYDFKAKDRVIHRFWIIDDKDKMKKITEIFDNIPSLYIADGHHRTAAAVAVGNEKKQSNPSHTGNEEYNYFMAVCFPENQLRIMDYNRVVKDLNHLTDEEFLKKISEYFLVEKKGKEIYQPNKLHKFSLYLAGNWYSLTAKEGTYNDTDPIEGLDVTVLSHYILDNILDIKDLRTNKRIDFVGGIRGLGELKRLVDSGKMKAAFALYPVSMKQLIAIADSGNIMPPKTTWFEPKLRSGLVIHELE